MPFADLDRAADAARSLLGTVLFTVLVITPDAAEVSRVHSTHPAVYPVGGRKRLDPTETTSEWAERILVQQQPFFGPDRAAVRSYFFDWETIESLGCGAIINTPVVHEGVTVGSINFLTVDGAWDEASVTTAMAITADATAAVVEARAREFPELRP